VGDGPLGGPSEAPSRLRSAKSEVAPVPVQTSLPLSNRLRDVAPVVRRLNAVAALNQAELALIGACAEKVETHRPGMTAAAEGAPRKPRMILSGWACRQRILSDGRRQLFDLLLPGDIPEFGAAPGLAASSLVAITRLECADATSLWSAALDPVAHPGLAKARAADAAQEQARLLDHMVRLGRSTAEERVAHLLLEMIDRMTAVGIGDGRSFPFPPTQQVLADLLGLSMVHINRTLQQLRRAKMIELKSGRFILLDPPRMTALAGYNAPVASAGSGRF
jgi:CRP-like cAMP-binding protein